MFTSHLKMIDYILSAIDTHRNYQYCAQDVTRKKVEKMRKFTFIILFLALSGAVNASQIKNTLSLGYANSHYTGVISGNSPGFNIKYNIQNTTNKLGLMTSITSTSQELHMKNRNSKGRISHLSVTAGPSWYINEAVNIYGLAGISHDRVKYSKASGSDNSFTWGAGVSLTPSKNWSFDTSYEFLRNSDTEKNGAVLKAGTWVMGVGYSF